MKPEILQRVKAFGHQTFENGAYNANIIGVRSATRKANRFDDTMHFVCKDWDGYWVHMRFRCTTDPGTYWLTNPGKIAGTAILCPGQYRGVYQIGKHRGYPALVQTGGQVKIYRDKNRDSILDMEPETAVNSGYIGLNIHHAGNHSTRVDKWSAGCQVLSHIDEWNVFFSLVKLSASVWGPRFTYTLLED